MTLLSPIVTPGNTIAPTPSHTLLPMTMGFAASFLHDEDPVRWGE